MVAPPGLEPGTSRFVNPKLSHRPGLYHHPRYRGGVSDANGVLCDKRAAPPSL